MEIQLGVNSYLTIEEANNIAGEIFIEGEKESKVWDSLSDKVKTQLILKATQRLDKLLFRGIKYIGAGSKLAFPRIIDCRVMECPYEYKCGIVALAIQLKIGNKQYEELLNMGVKNYSIEGASIGFRDIQGGTNMTEKIIIEEYLTQWIY